MNFIDKIPADKLTCRLCMCSIENELRCKRLRWYGHFQRIDPDTWPRKVDKTIATGSNPRDCPRKA